MAPSSMDLRQRVVRARESGLSSKEVAAKYEVSLAWVNRWLQRRRDTGTLAPRKQTHWREPKLAAHTAGRTPTGPQAAGGTIALVWLTT